MYRKCKYCGASLDPGEICDCTKEAAPDEQDPEAAREKERIDSIAEKNQIVNKGETK